jgi:hypothetical protein
MKKLSLAFLISTLVLSGSAFAETACKVRVIYADASAAPKDLDESADTSAECVRLATVRMEDSKAILAKYLYSDGSTSLRGDVRRVGTTDGSNASCAVNTILTTRTDSTASTTGASKDSESTNSTSSYPKVSDLKSCIESAQKSLTVGASAKQAGEKLRIEYHFNSDAWKAYGNFTLQ